MPPKKIENKDQYSNIDYKYKLISSLYSLQTQDSISLVLDKSNELIEIITRQEIVQNAIEKGLYIDLNNLSEKDKASKNFKPDPSKTELTTEIMTNSFLLLMEDKEINVKKIKKEILDNKNKAIQKPDPKQKGKVDEKQPQILVEEPQEIQNNNKIDKIYILNDFPNEEEISKLKQVYIECFIMNVQKKVKEQNVDLSLLDQLQMSEEQLKNRLNQFISSGQEVQQDQVQKTNESTKVNKLSKIKQYLKQIQNEQKIEVIENKIDDKIGEDQGIKIVQLVEDYINKLTGYEEFVKSIKIIPSLFSQEKIDEAKIKMEWKKNINDYQKRAGNRLQQMMESLLFVIQMNEHPKQKQNIQEIDKNQDQDNIFLQQLLEKYSDQLLSDQQSYKSISHNQTLKKDLKKQVINELFIDNLQTFVNQFNIQKKKDPNINKISAQKQIIGREVKMTMEEFEEKVILQNFKKLMEEKIKEREYDFSSYKIREDLSKEEIRDRLYEYELEEADIDQFYDLQKQQLQIIMHFYNPPGRVCQKYFTYKKNVMPDYVQYCSNQSYYDSQKELYGFSNMSIIKQRTQLMYPDDNSILRIQRNQIGNDISHKISIRSEEGHTMGLKHRMFYYHYPQLRINFQFIKQQQVLIDLVQHNQVTRFDHLGQVIQNLIHDDDNSNKSKNYQEMVSRYQFIVQKIFEKKRVITHKGKVIKYMQDGTQEIFTPNGQIYQNKKNGIWIITMKDGQKWKYNSKTKQKDLLGTVNNSVEYSINEMSKIIVREDKCAFSENNKELISRFYDGTVITRDNENNRVIIQHPQYLKVQIEFDQVKMRMASVIGYGSSFASIGYNSIMDRSYSGIIIKTFIDEHNYMVQYQEKQQQEDFTTCIINWIYILYCSDGSIFKFQQDGTALYIGSQARHRIETVNHIDSFIQLFGVKEERKQGVYFSNLEQGFIETRDSQSNCFKLFVDGQVDNKIAVSLDTNQKYTNKNLDQPDISNGFYINPNNLFLPPPLQIIPPALFLLNANMTGCQYHTKQVLKDTMIQYKSEVTDSFIAYNQNTQKESQIRLPKILEKDQQTEIDYNHRPKEIIHYKTYKNFKELDQHSTMDSLDSFQIDNIISQKLNKYSKVSPSEKHLDQEFDIQMKIYELKKLQNIDQ